MSNDFNSVQKAAVLLMSLETHSPGVASKIFSEIGEKRSKRLLKAISELGKIDSDSARSVMDEFYDLAIDQKVVLGGRIMTQKFLRDSFGIQEQDDFLASKSGAFDFLSSSNLEALVRLLSQESDQFVALVCLHISESHVSRVLSQFPANRVSQIVQLMVSMNIPSQTFVWRLAMALEEKLRDPGEAADPALQSKESVVKASRSLEIMSEDLRTSVMSQLTQSQPEVADTLSKAMFYFDDLERISTDDLKTILYDVEPMRMLALALSGATESLKETIQSVVSERFRHMLQEEMDLLPEMISQNDVQHCRQFVVIVARRLEKEGRVNLGDRS